MIPVEVTTAPWHYTTFPEALDHWQTLIAGFLAFVAGVGTVVAAIWAIWVTRSSAKEQIAASRADADRVIDTTREQTRATFKQTETTVDLQQMRDASEALAFHAMLAAAMDRVLAEQAGAKETYPQYVGQAQGASIDAKDSSPDAIIVRQCITKGAFAELRAACVRRGGSLTGEFLDLEREIDSFAMQSEDKIVTDGFLIRVGKHAGLREQFARIEMKATKLRERGRRGLRGKDLMVRIAISVEAFEAICATLPLGSVSYDNAVNERGEHYVWLPPNVVDRLRAQRRPGESYSDVILRIAASAG